MMGIDLRQWRERLNLTQERAANLFGISRRGWIKRESDESPISMESALACAFVSERANEGFSMEPASLAGIAARVVSGARVECSSEYAGRFQTLIALMNQDRRGAPITVPRLAEAMGLERAGDLGRYVTGAEEPSFKFLEDFSSAFGVSPDWLKYGYGAVFQTLSECGYEPLKYLAAVKPLKPKAIYFLRAKSERGEGCIVCKISDFRYVTSRTLNHISNEVGATGERQLYDLHSLIKKVRDNHELGSPHMVGAHLDPETYRSLTSGAVYPAAIVDNLNVDLWWDDFGDLCEDERRVSEYGEGFIRAVWRVKSVARYLARGDEERKDP